jgi:hypothetical protein
MNQLDISKGEAGETIVTHAEPIEQRSAQLARSIQALTDLLTLPGGLAHLANCPQDSQAEVFALLRALTREQSALAAEIERKASFDEREEGVRRAFQTGYNAGLQHTSSVRGEILMNEAVIHPPAGYQHGARTESTTEH